MTLTFQSFCARLTTENNVPVAPNMTVKSPTNVRQIRELATLAPRTERDESFEWNRHGRMYTVYVEVDLQVDDLDVEPIVVWTMQL